MPGFDFSNSPAELAEADLAGYDVVQRTSAGTRGVVEASSDDTALVRQPGLRDRDRGCGDRKRFG